MSKIDVKQRISGWLRKNKMPYLLLLPSVIFIATFMLYPLGYGIFLSFHKWSGWGVKSFVGLSNFKELLYDARFWAAGRNNIVWTVMYVPGVVLLGLVLALLVDLRIPGWRVFRFAYFLPVMLMVSVVAILWSKIYNPYSGLVNSLLELVGLASFTRAWLGEPKFALFAIIIMAIWQACGWSMILFFASMGSIPQSIYDAARIDGTGTWQRIWLITLPMMKPIIAIVVTLQTISSLKVFGMIWVMTAGGPGRATEVVPIYMMYRAFHDIRIGYGSAIAVLFAGFILLVSVFYVRSMARSMFEY